MNHVHPSSSAGAPPLLPPSPCPVCGGLECLCRPRFFAGQLLSEEDLRALDHYLIEKNKLHNRYVHGWGVVCGLEVVCHPCRGWVTIKSGYAIDPCGNDIIVCEDYSFDLCARIRECCDRKRNRWECEPMGPRPEDCQDIEQCWYVTLRYREFESRGITALKQTSSPPGQTCGCGGGSSQTGCSCGSGGSVSAANGRTQGYNTASSRRPAQQCEPTRTCESYVVEVAPAPHVELGTNADVFRGTLIGELTKCRQAVAELSKTAPDPGQISTTIGLQQACCQFRHAVVDFLSSAEHTQCDLLQRAGATTCPPPPSTDDSVDIYRGVIKAAIDELQKLLLEYLRDCFCRAILPRCPGDPGDPRVILACVTVQERRDVSRAEQVCEAVDICHLHGRRMLATWPNVLYWLSIFPIPSLVRRALERFCCEPRDRRDRPLLANVAVLSRAGLFTASQNETAAEMELLRTLLALFAQGAEGAAFGDASRGIAFAPHVGGDAETVAAELRREQPDLQLGTQNVEWPMEVWLLHQLLQPLLGLSETRAVAYTSGKTVMGFGAAPLTELRDEVARLSQRVEEQQKTIDDLRRQPPGQG
jgi:hypothetical protein